MSRALIKALAADRRGVAVVEMAFVAPVIAGLALVSFEVWQAAGRSRDVKAALQTGAQYYMNGGTDDAAARTLALSAWSQPPANAEVTVERGCACQTVAHICTSLCSDGTPPLAFVTLRASGDYPQVVFNAHLSDERVVRVR